MLARSGAIRRLGGQAEAMSATPLEQVLYPGDFVRPQVIHHDHVASSQAGASTGSPAANTTSASVAPTIVTCGPSFWGTARAATLPPRRSPMQTGHRQLDARCSDDLQPWRVEWRDPRSVVRTRPLDARGVLRAGMA